MAGRVRVFLASSLDGFIAGPGDELDWLEGYEGAEDTFTPFFAQIGALLLGRRSYDVVAAMEGSPWFYGDTPVLVATSRPLESDRETVRAVRGDIAEVVAEARRVAGDRDVYVDGGSLVRSALDAGLVDVVAITWIPVALGDGVPLFAGCRRRHRMDLVSSREIGGGLVQAIYAVPTGGTSPG